MKKLLLLVYIVLVSTSCSNDKLDEVKYDIYSSVVDKEFGHFSPNSPYIIGINDTISDFNNELGTLIYSVKNNHLFFTEYCKGDTSFRKFILAIKIIKTDREVMEIEKLKSKTKEKINLNKLIKNRTWHHTINFSKVVLNESKDKAILFIVGQSSGSWYFVELTNKKWTVKHEILSWVI